MISLLKETWEHHIVVNHPEMKRHLDGVKLTLEDPLQIQHQEDRYSTFYYYRYLREKVYKRTDLLYLAVVKRNDMDHTGRVMTAHLLKNIRSKGGEIVWQQPKKV